MPEKAVYSLTDEGEKEFVKLMMETASKPIHFFLDFNAVIVNLDKLPPESQQSCIFNVFNVTMNNIVASEGAAKTTMCALLLGAVLNIGLDPIFIYTLDMGVAGAAIATAISQMASLKEKL